MKRRFTILIFFLCFLFFNSPISGREALSSSNDLPKVDSYSLNQLVPSELPQIQIADHRNGITTNQFVRYGLCQVDFLNSGIDSRGLWVVDNPEQRVSKIASCADRAVAEGIDVLVFPELSLNLSEVERNQAIKYLQGISVNEDMIIIAGSYYDEECYQRTVVIGPHWIEYGYKYRPSRFEVSPRSDEGMKRGENLLVLKTKYGDFALIVCADLISDDVQYCLRRMATCSMIDEVIDISYNPASWEFLIEANSIVRRHPVFFLLVNVFKPPKDNIDNGYSYGHSAVFANIRTGANNAPNSDVRILDLLPDPVVARDEHGNAIGRLLPYSEVVADMGVFKQGILICELNMLLNIEPQATNAPDQGYPPVRGIRYVEF